MRQANLPEPNVNGLLDCSYHPQTLIVSPYNGAVPWANVVLLCHMDGTNGSTTFIDSSQYGHTISVAGNAQISTAQSKFGGASYKGDGNGDWIYVTASSSPASKLRAASKSFTDQFWYKSNDATQVSKRFIAVTIPGGTLPNTSIQRVISISSTGTLQAVVVQGGTGTRVGNDVAAATALDGNWHFVELNRTGDEYRLYFDGVQQGATLTLSGSLNDSSSMNYHIGSITNSGAFTSFSFNGWIDDVRMVENQAVNTSNYTIPASAFPNY